LTAVHNERLRAGKSRLFWQSTLSPDSQSLNLGREMADSLRRCPRNFPFCGDYRWRQVRSRAPRDLGTLPRPILWPPTGRTWESVTSTAARPQQGVESSSANASPRIAAA
jgi:hypothetical protein